MLAAVSGLNHEKKCFRTYAHTPRLCQGVPSARLVLSIHIQGHSLGRSLLNHWARSGSF